MIGAIIGDTVGSRFEFNNTSDYNFPLFPPGSRFTDDTVCTIAVADALLSGLDFREALQSWCRRYPRAGYGRGFRRWIAQDDAQPYGSFGNGAAMRVSPVGWAFREESEVIRAAMRSAAVSHNHSEGLIGAVAVALAIHRLRHGATLSDIDALAVGCYGEAWESRLPVPGRFDVTCQGCVPLSFHLLKQSHNFEDALRRAISYGGDSDTLGAIVGSMAEACFGVDKALEEQALTYLSDEMRDVVARFKAKYLS